MSETPEETPTKTPKSPTVLLALWLFAISVGGGLIATFTVAVAPLAIIIALTAVGVCVLSLREL
jgi:CHASE2 domain-containing sensor protein